MNACSLEACILFGNTVPMGLWVPFLSSGELR